MKKKTIRPLGDVTSDLEEILLEMTWQHGLQWGEVLHLVHGYLSIHCPGDREEYDDGGHPEFYYGYPRGMNDDK